MAIALLISTSGETSRLTVDQGHDGLAALQEAVGGHFEGLTISEVAYGYIHGEGKIIGLPRNWLATRLCAELGAGLAEDDFIAGPMVVVGGPDRDGHDLDVPAEVEGLAGQILRRSQELARGELPVNCLAGMRCPNPECASVGPFKIMIRMVVAVYDDGTDYESLGDTEFANDSLCTCPECDHHATVGHFKTHTAPSDGAKTGAQV